MWDIRLAYEFHNYRMFTEIFLKTFHIMRTVSLAIHIEVDVSFMSKEKEVLLYLQSILKQKQNRRFLIPLKFILNQ